MNKQTSKKLGIGMGVFGIALGAAEALFPKTVARMIGVDPDGVAPIVLRAMGIRELAATALIFAKPDSTLGRWARVAGDAVDLGLLATAAFSKDAGRLRLAGAAAAVLGATALDLLASMPAEDAAELAPVPQPANGKGKLPQPVAHA